MVLVTGYAGQLGWDVVHQLENRGVPCKGVDVNDFDLTDGEAVLAAVRECRPDVIVHCAAYTAVDRAEKEPEKCAAVNGVGTMNLVRAAQEVRAKFVYISTDYVFPGTGETPWRENDEYGPQNVYGLTKMQGEIAVRGALKRFFILRTSWVFGAHGNNFVRTMLRLGAEKSELRVVNDQIGSPTYTQDLARVICDLIPTERYGIYHVRNEGFISWAQFARMIMEARGLPCAIVPVTTEEYGSATKRPLNSRLSAEALAEAGIEPMPTVQDALTRYLNELDRLEPAIG